MRPLRHAVTRGRTRACRQCGVTLQHLCCGGRQTAETAREQAEFAYRLRGHRLAFRGYSPASALVTTMRQFPGTCGPTSRSRSTNCSLPRSTSTVFTRSFATRLEFAPLHERTSATRRCIAPPQYLEVDVGETDAREMPAQWIVAVPHGELRYAVVLSRFRRRRRDHDPGRDRGARRARPAKRSSERCLRRTGGSRRARRAPIAARSCPSRQRQLPRPVDGDHWCTGCRRSTARA